jgi:hypothetical protein
VRLPVIPPCSGFRNSQSNACTTPEGSCLKNQIKDLYFADLARINAGGKGWVGGCAGEGGGGQHLLLYQPYSRRC